MRRRRLRAAFARSAYAQHLPAALMCSAYAQHLPAAKYIL